MWNKWIFVHFISFKYNVLKVTIKNKAINIGLTHHNKLDYQCCYSYNYCSEKKIVWLLLASQAFVILSTGDRVQVQEGRV